MAYDEGDPINEAIAKLVELLGVQDVLSYTAFQNVIKKAALQGIDIPTALSLWADKIKTRVSDRDEREPVILELDLVEEKEEKYIWSPYIPCAALTNFVGAGGVGKDTWCYYLMYLSVLGRLDILGDTDIKTPIHVLYSSIENDPAKKIKPQIKSYGGNTKLIKLCNGLKNKDTFNFSDLDIMRRILKAAKPDLWIIDNAGDFSADGDGHNYRAVVKELLNLTILAEEFQCAILLIVHENKSGGYMGSVAYNTKPRSCITYKKTATANQRILQHIKTNDFEGPAVLFNAKRVKIPGRKYPVWQVEYAGIASDDDIAGANNKEITKQKQLNDWLWKLLLAKGVHKLSKLKDLAEVHFANNPSFNKTGEFKINGAEWTRAKQELNLVVSPVGWSIPPLAIEALTEEPEENLI